MKQGRIIYNQFTREYYFIDSKDENSRKRFSLGRGLDDVLGGLGNLIDPNRKISVSLEPTIPEEDYQKIANYFKETKVRLGRE